MARAVVWMIGDADDPSLAAAADWLRRKFCTRGAQERAKRAVLPAAIVAFQSRPGQFPRPQVEELRRQAPRAKLVVLAGPWCEGEPRSPRPAEGVSRIYWHQWQARLPQALAAGRQPPRTLTQTDLLLRTLKPAWKRGVSGRVMISTLRRESYAALADACGVAGLRASWWQAPAASPVAADLQLLDGWDALWPAYAAVPSILLLDWPRPEDLARAEELEIGRVLAKPLLVPDLAEAFDAVHRRSARALASPAAA